MSKTSHPIKQFTGFVKRFFYVAPSRVSRYKPTMQTYLNLLRQILDAGEHKADRTGTGTLSLFGLSARYDLRAGFPLVTTKKIHLKSVIHELLWFLRGETNVASLQSAGVRIWDEWADENGELGPVYGKQWRSWETANGRIIDQIFGLVKDLKQNPNSRRHIVTAWNPAEIHECALPPCHVLFQFYVSNDRRLSCSLYQRSADMFLGAPFNIASYALLTLMLAQVCDYQPGEFVHMIGDAHIYSNHLEQVREQISRAPRSAPIMKLNPSVKDIFEFRYEDFSLEAYDPHPHIKAEVAV